MFEPYRFWKNLYQILAGGSLDIMTFLQRDIKSLSTFVNTSNERFLHVLNIPSYFRFHCFNINEGSERGEITPTPTRSEKIKKAW